jgi:lipoic acid synthetase
MISRKPEWIRMRFPVNSQTRHVREILSKYGLNTVCQSALCPNTGQCFAEGTAAFLIMGPNCTRNCRFCAVAKDKPIPLDPHEPEKLAQAAKDLNLSYAVITSVTRDDLPDGGAEHYAAVVETLHREGIKVEVLTPDFGGNTVALAHVVASGPEVFNHNLETVPRLYSEVRPGADYERSLALIREVKRLNPQMFTKSGLMVGLGETEAEVECLLRDLRDAQCDRLTIGQYLQPSRNHLPVVEYVPQERFERWREYALELGFERVNAGPLVRSSYRAGV